jgi:hypothetical protein
MERTERPPNKIGGIRMIVPIKIVGVADGTWDKMAWQTDAFYGAARRIYGVAALKRLAAAKLMIVPPL